MQKNHTGLCIALVSVEKELWFINETCQLIYELQNALSLTEHMYIFLIPFTQN